MGNILKSVSILSFRNVNKNLVSPKINGFYTRKQTSFC